MTIAGPNCLLRAVGACSSLWEDGTTRNLRGEVPCGADACTWASMEFSALAVGYEYLTLFPTDRERFAKKSDVFNLGAACVEKAKQIGPRLFVQMVSRGLTVHGQKAIAGGAWLDGHTYSKCTACAQRWPDLMSRLAPVRGKGRPAKRKRTSIAPAATGAHVKKTIAVSVCTFIMLLHLECRIYGFVIFRACIWISFSYET